MLYDQAQLACSYIDAFQITRDKRIRSGRTRHSRLRPARYDRSNGGVYSAEDADSIIEHGKPDHAEGAFYVWTKAEITKLLGPDERGSFSIAFTAWRRKATPRAGAIRTESSLARTR